MSDDWIAVIALAFIVVLTITVGAWWSSSTCDTRAQSFDHEWHLVGGCMVEYKGKWIPLENIRGYGDE